MDSKQDRDIADGEVPSGDFLPQAQTLADQATDLIDQGELEAGLSRMDQAIDVVAEVGGGELESYFLVRKGILLIRADRSDQGLAVIENAFELAVEGENPRLVEEIRSRRGLALVELGRVNEGLSDLQMSLEEAERRSDHSQTFRILGLMGDAYRMAADESNSEASYLRAIELAEGSNEPIDITAARLGLGQARLAAGKARGAAEALEPAVEYARRNEDLAREREVLTSLSEAYLQLDRREALLATTERLLELAERNQDQREAITQRENLITVLFSLDRLEEALPQIEEALAYARRRGPRERKLVHLLNLGRVQYELGEYTDAEVAYKEALELAEDQENVRAVATILGRLGALYAEMDDLDAALRFGELAVTRAGDLHDAAIMAEQNILLAMTYQDLGRVQEASEAARRAKVAYKEQGESALAERANQLLDDLETAEA
ncbi:MAG: tetratricopeptide repeat protein [Anaerolineales bacterium]